MTRVRPWLVSIIPAVLAALAGHAISGKDKYALHVPNGLAFAEFKGYEDRQPRRRTTRSFWSPFLLPCAL